MKMKGRAIEKWGSFVRSRFGATHATSRTTKKKYCNETRGSEKSKDSSDI